MIAKALVFLPRLIFFPTKIIHKERLPKNKRYLAVTNHQSWIDIVYCLFSLPRRRYIIAKKELKKSRFLRGVRKWCGIIFIDRENPSVDSVREILAVLKRDEPIIMFPEGTRNKENRELQEIKSGAASFAIKTDAPVIPIMIYKRAKIFHRNYIYVGESLDLSGYKDVRLTPEVTAEVDKKVRDHMLKTMAEMDDYVENKRWKKKNRLPESAGGETPDGNALSATGGTRDENGAAPQ
jgi:1-acyl-sn-glycerol-3-phosphate acyltransferase